PKRREAQSDRTYSSRSQKRKKEETHIPPPSPSPRERRQSEHTNPNPPTSPLKASSATDATQKPKPPTLARGLKEEEAAATPSTGGEMVFFALLVGAELDGLTNLQPRGGCDDPSYPYYFKVRFLTPPTLWSLSSRHISLRFG
uniref:Uncharacterized protein n=1 Tax=Aegilops tauschii subsp. strangulata TaxID=200361 RepID=A0A453EXF8_AEGTS